MSMEIGFNITPYQSRDGLHAVTLQAVATATPAAPKPAEPKAFQFFFVMAPHAVDVVEYV